MIALILSGGFGTRLDSVTKGAPKALVEVGGTTLLERLLRQCAAVPSVHRTVIVSNGLHAQALGTWLISNSAIAREATLVNDGITSPDHRLGAIGDIALAIDRAEIDDDLLILASDCLVRFPLGRFVAFFEARLDSCVVVKRYPERRVLRDGACVWVGDDGLVIKFEEKPADPGSSLGALPVYIYPRQILGRFREFMRLGRDPDSPGRFPEWLTGREPLRAFELTARQDCLDVGTPEGYADAAARETSANSHHDMPSD